MEEKKILVKLWVYKEKYTLKILYVLEETYVNARTLPH